MKFHHHIFSVALCLLPFIAAARVTENFDANWNFLQADATGAETNNFNDSAWKKLNLPHDWSIAGPFSETNETGGAGGFLPSGIGWYRKHFTLPKTDSDKSISIEFDGVMQNSDVWINGFHLGHRPNGCVSFSYELTGHLNFGGDNILAVRADTSAQPASRWYSGAGIYRHVRLIVNDQIHFAENGFFISTSKVSATEATVKIETTITNAAASKRKITLVTQLISPDGKIVAGANMSGAIIAGASEKFSPQIVIANP
ncbi:MAG TPA: sugar-binding domain-containing protein, partial [Verrucomicrobiae bacterium]